MPKMKEPTNWEVKIKKENMKKPVCFFAVGSKEYSKYAIPFWRSMTKFHSPKDIDMIWYTDEKDPKVLEKLPKGIKIADLTPLLIDPGFYYRQKPIIMEMLLDDYELVVGFDTDMLILGSLSKIIEVSDYDIGTVYNFNRFDQQYFPQVEMYRIGISPAEYFNCSLVASRNQKFVHNWKVLCFSPQFDRVQYREQDILNVLCYYGNYNVRCFDLPFGQNKDGTSKYFAWHGPISKGELTRTIVKNGDIVVEKGLGSTPFPPENVVLKAVTLAGGHGAVKDNWSAFFPPDVIRYINENILK
jgi:hypothetical protein